MIELRSVTKRYGQTTAIDGVSLLVPKGELVVLLGPSGCGKTTLLRAINRMVEIDDGVVLIDGAPNTTLPPEELRRRIGYAIQSVGLFPHMTVARNIATVPRLLGWDRERVAQRVTELLSLVGLDPALYGHKHPHELSGGEAQRVGVARALAADPPLLLMDEPFGALDPINRERLQREFVALHNRLGKTVVFVTHDIEEAVMLGDRIVLMRDGRIVQEGSPDRLWRMPADEFTRDFFGDEFGLRVLSRHRVGDLTAGVSPGPDAPRVTGDTTLRDVLAIMVTRGTDTVAVMEGERLIGGVSFSDIIAQVRETP